MAPRLALTGTFRGATYPVAGLAILALGALLVACEDDDGGSPGGADLDRFRAFVSAAGEIDYEPLHDPVAAIKGADAIVLGEVVGATLAREVVDAASDRETRYVILTVAVRTVLAGVLPEPAGEVVYVALRVAGVDPAKEIEDAVPRVATLLVLDDWRPSGQLAGFPEQVYAPLTDGAWFEVGDRVEGLWVARDEVEERWGEEFESIDELAALVEAAAAQ